MDGTLWVNRYESILFNCCKNMREVLVQLWFPTEAPDSSTTFLIWSWIPSDCNVLRGNQTWHALNPRSLATNCRLTFASKITKNSTRCNKFKNSLLLAPVAVCYSTLCLQAYNVSHLYLFFSSESEDVPFYFSQHKFSMHLFSPKYASKISQGLLQAHSAKSWSPMRRRSS